jgi:tetratricopeptide (TPR) repeat protein
MLEPHGTGRRTRVGSVAVGYLGASWLILQVVDVVGDILPLPSWVGPGVLVLLGIGLLLVTATAWVQADPDTTRREEAGELPGDWEVAPKQAFTALLHGRLPHLTWGRTLLGGLVALSLLFGSAGLYVLISDRPTDDTDEASGPAKGVRIASMPFATTGPDLEVYREGMVELLATNLDGLGDIRAIASRTVLARWDEMVGSDSRPDLDAVLEAARSTGATHALVGSLVAAAGDIRINAELYDLQSRAELSVPGVQGSDDEILDLVDRLSVSVARSLLGAESIEAAGSRLASLTTPSVPALRFYLQGEALYRRAEFLAALPFLERAIEADPAFGLAVMRRAQALGWLPGLVAPDTLEAARLAIGSLLDGMSQRDATLAEAGIIDYAERDADGPRRLREFVARYPDDAEGWYQLSDFLFHLNNIRGGTRDEVLLGFDRAVDLGPQFAPYYIHGIQGALFRGDTARTRQLLEEYRGVAGEDDRWAAASLLRILLLDPEAEIPAELAERVPDHFTVEAGRILAMSAQPGTLADIAIRYLPPGDFRRVTAMLRAGRWEAVRTAAEEFPPAIQSQLQATALAWIGAFGLDRSSASLIWDGPLSVPVPDYWIEDPLREMDRLLTARDDGTGADPVLLAHLADRAGDIERAERFLTEESWREFGPAMLYRLGNLYRATDRPAEAGEAYTRFLEMWSGADPELPPVVIARDFLEGLRR